MNIIDHRIVSSARTTDFRGRSNQPYADPGLMPSPLSREEFGPKDLTVHSAGTILRGVKATQVEPRPWIEQFPVCPALDQYHLLHVGIMEAQAPTRIVRPNQSTTYFLATFGGKGTVLVDGQWKVCAPGSACLLPKGSLNAFAALPQSTWKYCFACYKETPEQRGALPPSAVIGLFESTPMLAAMTGLLHETQHGRNPALIQRWVDLIHNYVAEFSNPHGQFDTLSELWKRVESNLGDKWNLARLTRESGYSREHLRRLCRARLGRGPIHQVTHLRLKRAAELLRNTDLTIDAIAENVGYQNGFVFSNSFKRWIGWRPSDYRRGKHASTT